jgi:hypothetical protein
MFSKQNNRRWWWMVAAAVLAVVLYWGWAVPVTEERAPLQVVSRGGLVVSPPPVPVRRVDSLLAVRFSSEWAAPGLPAADDFRRWTEKYLATGGPARAALVPEGVALASSRRIEMLALIMGDPQRAIETTVPFMVRQQLPEPVVARLERRIAGTGSLEVAIIDPLPGYPQVPFWREAKIDEVRYRAYVYGRRLEQHTKYDASLVGVAIDNHLAISEHPIRALDNGETAPEILDNSVTGTVSLAAEVLIESHGKTWAARVADVPRILREAVAAETGNGPYVAPLLTTAAPDNHRATASGWATGLKRLIAIRIDFSDNPGSPNDYLFGPLSEANGKALCDGVLAQFFQNNSFGATSIVGTVTPRVYRMPRTSADYVDSKDFSSMRDEAVKQAKADLNVDEYDRIAVVFSPVSGKRFNWAGIADMGGKFLWCQNEFSLRLLSHELGHTYGLSHANTWTPKRGDPAAADGSSVEYGDSCDAMSSYGGDHHDFSAYGKNLLGWLPDGQVTTVTESGTFRVYAHDNPAALSNPTLGLKIARPNGVAAGKFCWVSLRAQNELTEFNGVALVQWAAASVGPSNLLDCLTPGQNIRDAGLPVGAVFVDSTVGFTVKALAKGGTGNNTYIDLAVTLNAGDVLPFFNIQPMLGSTSAIYTGDTFTITTEAAGNPAPTYQWYRDAVAISGATQGSYTVSDASVSDNGAYICRVSNKVGTVTSSSLRVTVSSLSKPKIVTQPVDKISLAYGQSGTISVSATGSALEYHWFYTAASGNTTSLGNDGTFSGTTTAALTIRMNNASLNGGKFRCRVGNTITSIMTTDTILSLEGPAPPFFSVQPNPVVGAVKGVGLRLQCAASGVPAPDYQWMKEGVPIAGATQSTLFFAEVQSQDFGRYTCVASNTAASVSSNISAVVEAGALPVIFQQPAAQIVAAGDTVTLTCAAYGFPSGYSSWTRDGAYIANNNSTTLTIANFKASDQGNYICTITSNLGTTRSQPISVMIKNSPPLAIGDGHVINLSMPQGTPADLSFNVAANPAPTFRWLKNGAVIPGATSSSLTVPSVQLSDLATYVCVATNPYGEIRSKDRVILMAPTGWVTLTPDFTNSTTLRVGGTATLTVKTAGGVPTSYRWVSYGTNGEVTALPEGSTFSGTQTPSLTIKGSLAINNYVVALQVGVSYLLGSTRHSTQIPSISAYIMITQLSAPVILVDPIDCIIAPQGRAVFGVSAMGNGMTYRWQRQTAGTTLWSSVSDDEVFSGATTAILTLSNTPPSMNGDKFRVQVTGDGGSRVSNAAGLSIPWSRLANLSVRTNLATGQALTVGVVTSGAKNILVRAVGPSLGELFGVQPAYPDPTITLLNGGAVVGTNSGWPSTLSGVFASTGAFPLSSGSKDAAVLKAVKGDTVAQVTGKGSGIVLLEAYDADPTSTGRLINVSARNQVGTGSNVLIAGFVIEGTSPKMLLIRGSGPALTALFGVPNTLADPVIKVYRQDGTLLGADDNWKETLAPAFAKAGAFPFPSGSADAALVLMLASGAYTVQLSGANGSGGDGLVEIYDITP